MPKFPDRLNPRRKMPRNELCWCNSGRKWKKCHLNRERQERPTLGRALNDAAKTFEREVCLHPEASPVNCSKRIIRAHTVQKRGGLGSISEEGHVISAKKSVRNIGNTDGKIIPEREGINKATTIRAFCSKHDNELFEPIEQPSISLDPSTTFLFAFRAVAYEFYTKMASAFNKDADKLLDAGQPFERQVSIQQMIEDYYHGVELGKQDIQMWKDLYDKRFLNSDFSGLPCYAIAFDEVLPFVCSGVFHPEVDFRGRRLQNLANLELSLEHVCLSVTSYSGRTYVVLAYPPGTKGVGSKFVDSFVEIPERLKANACIHLATEQLENVYFRPSWWTGLPPHIRNELNQRIVSGLPENAFRGSTSLTDLSTILPEIDVASEYKAAVDL